MKEGNNGVKMDYRTARGKEIGSSSCFKGDSDKAGMLGPGS